MNEKNSKIKYALVANSNTVLAEYPSKDSNVASVARHMISGIDTSKDGNLSTSYPKEKFQIHCLINNGIIYSCVADEGLNQWVSFIFLSNVKDKYVSKINGVASYQDDFHSTLGSEMTKANNKNNQQYHGQDKIEEIKHEIESVKVVVLEAIEKAIEKGEKLDALDEKAQGLLDNALEFNEKAKKLKRKMLWARIKLTLIIVFIVLIVVYVIFSAICNFDGSNC